MKSGLIVFFILLMGVACQNSSQNKNESPTVASAELTTVTLSVGGMTCAMCEASVQKGISQIAGVDSVSVTLGDSTAFIRYNPRETSLAEISLAVEKRGYKVKPE